MAPRLVLGTRGSALAQAQTAWTRARLLEAHPGLQVEIRIIETRGDREGAPLWAIGGKGLFTQELETELQAGRIDAAVHSLKDLPTALPDAFAVLAVPRRVDPRDALVTRAGLDFDALPPGTAVGTSSLRRMAQLVSQRPDLSPRNLRGNIDTRLGKVATGELPAALLAMAGLERLGRLPEAVAFRPLDLERFVPAAAQGALGIEGRAGDARVGALLAPLHDAKTAREVDTERALLARMGVGCHVPLGAHAVETEGRLDLRTFLAYPDGRCPLRATASGTDPIAVAADAHAKLMAAGAGPILELVNAVADKAMHKERA